MHDESEAYSYGNAQEHHQRINQPGDTGQIILIGNVPQGVSECDSGDEQYEGPDYHVAEMLAEAEMLEQNAEESPYESCADVSKGLGQKRCTDLEDEEIQNDRSDERSGAICKASSEYGTESGTAEGSSEVLFPFGFGFPVTDFRQPACGFIQGQILLGDVS